MSDASTQTIRVGVIGAGGNTKLHHIPKLQAIDGVEIVTVANRTRASGQAVADEFGIVQVADHWSEVIADDGLDAIVIGTWPDQHARLTIAALESGKHVLCEARLARDVAEAEAMVAAAATYPELVTQVVPSPYTLPFDRTIVRLMGEGYLGDLLAVEITDRTGFVDREAPRTWRQSTDLSGVNIMTLGIWYEPLLRWVGEATRVMAMGRTVVTRRPGPDGLPVTVDVPDHLDVLADLACGAQLRLHVSQVTGLGPTNAIHLYGSEGTLRISEGELSGGRRGDDALSPIEVSEAEAIGWRVEEEFVGAIRGTESITRTTFADGLKYLRFTEAVWRSVHEQRTVHLSELR